MAEDPAPMAMAFTPAEEEPKPIAVAFSEVADEPAPMMDEPRREGQPAMVQVPDDPIADKDLIESDSKEKTFESKQWREIIKGNEVITVNERGHEEKPDVEYESRNWREITRFSDGAQRQLFLVGGFYINR